MFFFDNETTMAGFDDNNELDNKKIEKKLIKKLLTDSLNNNEVTILSGLWKNFFKVNAKRYSLITEIIFELHIHEINKEYYIANISKLVDKAIENNYIVDYEKSQSYKSSLSNHIELAIVQKKYISDNLKNLKKGIEKAQNEVKKIEGVKNNIYTEFVAILGIFASIIFGVFGGFQEIQLIGKNLNTTPIPKLLIFSSLVMLGITLIIFLCFNAISKLTKLKLRSCNCEEGKCNCSFRKRHPTIFYSSCIYLYVLFVGFALRLYKYDDFKFNDLYNGMREGYDILPLLLLILPISIPFVVYGKRKIKEYRIKKISNNIKKFIKYKWNVHKNNKS